jgi:hypothetical protein
MDHQSESTPETQTHAREPHIIEYSNLMDVVQLSAARLNDVPGSIQANSFAEVLEKNDEATHERIRCDVGVRFDDSLLSFVTASIINRRHQDIVILAEATAGFEGYLPWEDKLQAHIHKLQQHGMLAGIALRVERYSLSDESIETLTRDAQDTAIKMTPEYHDA